MAKTLSDMTLEELWELFPIVLTEHKAEWVPQYEDMALVLREALSAYKIIRISHIGSTAARKAMGLTQAQFAKELQVSCATMNRWENGRHVPAPIVIGAIKTYCSSNGI